MHKPTPTHLENLRRVATNVSAGIGCDNDQARALVLMIGNFETADAESDRAIAELRSQRDQALAALEQKHAELGADVFAGWKLAAEAVIGGVSHDGRPLSEGASPKLLAEVIMKLIGELGARDEMLSSIEARVSELETAPHDDAGSDAPAVDSDAPADEPAHAFATPDPDAFGG